MGIIKALTTTKDSGVPVMTARVKSGSSGDEFVTAARYVSQITLSSGVSGSHAWLYAPLKKAGPGQYDRQMMEVALKRGGPLGQVKLRGRAAASYLDPGGKSVDLLVGSLVEATHTLNEDSGLLQIWDDRWWLGQLTVTGVLVFDPQVDRFYWDFGREAMYNELGLPDCIDSRLGPCHSPCPKCGYNEANFKEPDQGDAKKHTRTWTVGDVVKNLALRFQLTSTKIPVYTGNRFLPPFIEWPAGLGVAMAGMSQPLKSIRLENMSLLNALQAIIRKAGPYDLYMSPLPDFRSRLEILDMGKTYPEVTLETADVSGAAPEDAIARKMIVTEGYITESCKGYFDEVVRIGTPPVIEAMFYQEDEYGLDAESNVLPGWEPAFLKPGETAKNYRQSAYFLAFKADILSNGDDMPALANAFKNFPLMAVGYRVGLASNPLVWAGTKYDGKANAGRMRIMPQNASGYNESATNPRDFFPREIVVEHFIDYQHETLPAPDPAHDPAFEWLTMNSNIALSPDSTVLMLVGCNTILQQGTTWTLVAGSDAPVGVSANFRLRPIRANITVQAEFPIVGVGSGDPNDTAERVEGQYKSSYAATGAPGDYVELLRSRYAWPLGKCGDGGASVLHPAQMAERDTVGNELYSDEKLIALAAFQRNADVRRVEKTGLLRIPALAAGMRPGICTQILSKDGLPIVGVTKLVTLSQIGHSLRNADDHAPDTWFEMGPADMAVLHELPRPGQSGPSLHAYKSDDYSEKRLNPYEDSSTQDKAPYQESVAPKRAAAADAPYTLARPAGGQASQQGGSINGQAIAPRVPSINGVPLNPPRFEGPKPQSQEPLGRGINSQDRGRIDPTEGE